MRNSLEYYQAAAIQLCYHRDINPYTVVIKNPVPPSWHPGAPSPPPESVQSWELMAERLRDFDEIHSVLRMAGIGTHG